jgi:hypothetical protein
LHNIVKYILSLIEAIALCLTAIPSNAQTFLTTSVILPNQRGANSNFGFSIDYDNNTLLVGAPLTVLDSNEGNPVNYAGAAYFFEKRGTSWIQTKFTSVEAANSLGENLGTSVKLNKEYAFIGAPYAFDSSYLSAGAVYVLRKGENGWNRFQKLLPTDYDLFTSPDFGASISSGGDYLAIGSPNENHSSGVVYLFHLSNGYWILQQKITAKDAINGIYFGGSVDLDGDRLIVGSYSNKTDSAGENELMMAGAAYIFTRTGEFWHQIIKLVPGNRARSDKFGYSVAIEDNIAVVGAPYKSYQDPVTLQYMFESTGTVFVFKNDSGKWVQNQIINAVFQPGAHFGMSMDLKDGALLIGAPEKDGVDTIKNYGYTGAGAAYFFRQNNEKFELVTKITDTEIFNSEQFGYSFVLEKDTVFIGKPGDSYLADPENEMYVTLDGSVNVFSLLPGIPTNYRNPVNAAVPEIYPNPTLGMVWINLKDPFQLIIKDLAGKTLFSGPVNTENKGIDLSDYPSGMYFFTFKSNSQISVLKIIKK